MNDKPVYVTKTFLPPIEEYEGYLNKIWGSGFITNQGPLLHEFEAKVADHLALNGAYFHFVANGTLAMQLALQALEIEPGEVITTPFSYVATISSIMWEHCKPVFVDIDPNSLGIDVTKIEAAITKDTRAIMPVHVFGIPAEVEEISAIALKHNLKVIYDGAHAFGVIYRGKSLLDYGDVTTASFHATKPFHTIEGGGIITRNKVVSERIELQKRFGHNGDEHYMLGINAKVSEFNAAMGLCNLSHIDDITAARQVASDLYDKLLRNQYRRPLIPPDLKQNYAYYPIIFTDESMLLRAKSALEAKNIFPRRYFFPSLNTLPYIHEAYACPISEDISSRILCLPLYPGLSTEKIEEICETITK